MSSKSLTSRVPLHRLKKDQVVYLATHYCKHGHTYLQHYSCYTETPERIGFFDIEASNLKADFGIVLSYCIKDSLSKTIYNNVIKPADIRKAKAGDEDKRLMAQMVQDLGKFDRIVTYYGSGFDVPFIRTRALATRTPFPNFGTLKHTDLYFVIKSRFNMSSKRLENACRVLLGETDKTRVDAKYWRGGVRGDAKSLNYILDHNKKDVLDLEKLYNKVIAYTKRTDTSI